ncbi:MAG TPA: ABC transporter substrate-binding protein [Burkholderiales bacterium]|nr:ABC transporter substrate-binding protein [Burkholderiales bacterium]
MNRRQAIGLLALAASQRWELHAQSHNMRRVGWLTGGSPKTHARLLDAFRDGLRERGWIEGRNLAIELRWAEGKLERLPGLAADLVQLKPDVIVTAANVVHLAVRKQTSTIPIVMMTGADPVAAGLAASFSHPGGNVTGLSGLYDEIGVKLIEIASSLVGRGARVAVLVDLNTPFLKAKERVGIERSAQSLGLRAFFVEVTRPEEIGPAFVSLRKDPPAALVVLPGSMVYAMHANLVARTRELGAAGIFPFEEMVDAGGLLSYGVNLPESYRRSAYFVDRILRGAKPGELPIEQPNQLHLAVNLKAARQQGIAMPRDILLRADRVIE